MNTTVSEKYVEAAIKHGAASREGDYKTANKAHKALMDALKEMRSLPDKGVPELLALINHSDSFVVCWAATHLLPTQEMIAKEVLEELSKNESDLAAFDASMVLREWKAGRLKVE